MSVAAGTRRITKRTVDSLKPGQLVWDAEVKGFGVRCQRTAKVYVLKTRLGGRQRWITIGRHGSPWTLEKARQKAVALLGEKASGRDPALARDAEKRNPTVADLVAAFLREHVEAKRKATTATGYRDWFNRLALPAIGKMRVTDVSHADIARLHHALKDAPYQANRVVAVLSSFFTWAERHGYRPRGTNPCQDVEPYKERKRERFLSSDELARLGEALVAAETEGEPPAAIAAIRLLVLTGCRKSEILTLQWRHVDFDLGALRLPDSKTGAKLVPLGAPALELLASLPRIEGNPYVVPGKRAGGHFVGLQKVWERVRTSAGFTNVRVHDLQHSFASVGAMAGDSLLVIGSLLGHRDQATTQRYVHLSNDPLKAAADRISGHIAAAMGNNSSANIVKLSKRSFKLYLFPLRITHGPIAGFRWR